QKIQRRAQGPHDADAFPCRAADAVADQHRIVLADDLPEVSRSGQMMMQAAIGDQEYLAPRDLAIDHPADVDTGLADQVTSQLDRELGFRQSLPGTCGKRAHVGAHSTQIQARLTRKVGYAEAAADVEQAYRRGGVGAQPYRQLQGLVLRLDDRLGAQILRTGEDVQADERQRQLREAAQYLRDALGIDAELLRATAHLHARGLELEVRVDADRDPRLAG